MVNFPFTVCFKQLSFKVKKSRSWKEGRTGGWKAVLGVVSMTCSHMVAGVMDVKWVGGCDRCEVSWRLWQVWSEVAAVTGVKWGGGCDGCEVKWWLWRVWGEVTGIKWGAGCDGCEVMWQVCWVWGEVLGVMGVRWGGRCDACEVRWQVWWVWGDVAGVTGVKCCFWPEPFHAHLCRVRWSRHRLTVLGTWQDPASQRLPTGWRGTKVRTEPSAPLTQAVVPIILCSSAWHPSLKNPFLALM